MTPPQINVTSLLHAGYATATHREWQRERPLTKANLMLPIFLTDAHPDACEPITAMPDVSRYGWRKCVAWLRPMVEEKGLRAVLLFGVPSGVVDADGQSQSVEKDACGTSADAESGPVIMAVRALREAFPELVIACDVCLCPYTDHGHCGRCVRVVKLTVMRCKLQRSPTLPTPRTAHHAFPHLSIKASSTRMARSTTTSLWRVSPK